MLTAALIGRDAITDIPNLDGNGDLGPIEPHVSIATDWNR